MSKVHSFGSVKRGKNYKNGWRNARSTTMSDWFVETTMLYGALGGAAINLVAVAVWGTAAGTVVMGALALAAISFERQDSE